jgi:hypothetical protein
VVVLLGLVTVVAGLDDVIGAVPLLEAVDDTDAVPLPDEDEDE